MTGRTFCRAQHLSALCDKSRREAILRGCNSAAFVTHRDGRGHRKIRRVCLPTMPPPQRADCPRTAISQNTALEIMAYRAAITVNLTETQIWALAY